MKNMMVQPENMARLIATNIRRVREYRNYTQKYMALHLGITQNAYSKLELGESRMTLERFFQIANLLKVSYSGLLQRYEEAIIELHIALNE